MRDSTHAGCANMQKYFQFEAIFEFSRGKKLQNLDWFLQISFHESLIVFLDRMKEFKGELVPASLEPFVKKPCKILKSM